MARKRLNAKDIDSLLNQYRSERRRLNFQLDAVRAAMADLKALQGDRTTVEEDDEAQVKRGPGRPRGSVNTVKKASGVAGRRKKRTIKNGGYRLSNWDLMVIDNIKRADRLLPKADLFETAKAWARKNEPRMKTADVELKLTRVLQKLSGKRGALGTYRSGLRRGYHYGIKDWFFASTGKLRKLHLDKLVLSEEA
ncbi:MAG: hypothetical protein ABI432_14200 [Flavobacteriales bacterium]